MEVTMDLLRDMLEQQAQSIGYALAAALDGAGIDLAPVHANLRKAVDLAYLAMEDEAPHTQKAAITPIQAVLGGIEDFASDLREFGSTGPTS